MIDPLGQTSAGFVAVCSLHGIGSGAALDSYTRCFREGVSTIGCAKVSPAPIAKRLEEQTDDGTTIKFCQRLGELGTPEHADIESVIIPMIGRTGRATNTLCVSSQVGCAMGCTFCETAQMGLVRNLSAAEIVGQWWAARFVEGSEIHNVVFMGMGEPLDNLDEVLAAIECLTDHRGPNLPMSAITVSTVGRVDGLRRLVEVVQQPGWKRLGIALSVNAPNDEVRSQIMPLNKKWGMDELREVMLELVATRSGRKVMFEYVLIPGVNDAPEHAGELARWMEPFGRSAGRSAVGLVNVIGYNPRRDSPWPAATDESVVEFVRALTDHGVYAKRRRTKGRSQMAACGQLGSASIRGRKFVGVTTSGRTND